MTPTEESRLLTIILKRVKSDPKVASHARWLSGVNWLVLVAAFIALFQVGPRVGPIVYVVAGVAGVLGVLTTFVVIHKRSLQQWPVLAPFIKADEIARRISELKPNKSLERTREG
jgi:hypothetical protein